MSKDLSEYRDKYLKGELNENDLPDNPFVLFSKWFDEVERFGTEIEPNAMSLSTVTINFSPITRIVLVKKTKPDSENFFNNTILVKGEESELTVDNDIAFGSISVPNLSVSSNHLENKTKGLSGK